MEKRRGFPPKRRRGKRKRKKVLRAKGFGESLAARPPGAAVESPPVTLTRQKACPLPRLAERAEARPEGAWSRERGGPKGRSPGRQKGVRTSFKSFFVGVKRVLFLGDEASGFWLRPSSFRVELKDPREGSFVSLWGLRGQRVRERALVHKEGKTEVEPAASRTCRRDRRANQRTSREVATSWFLFIWGIE